MYISTYEFIDDVGYGYKPNTHVNLSIADCDCFDLVAIEKLAKNTCSIQICDTKATTEWVIQPNKNANSLPELKVKKVIFSNPATIVFWSDDTKTVVKCGKNDTYDKEKGFYIACAKKLFGNDYKAVGRMNKALMMAETKEENNE